ncbi:hypothetical protein I553_9385 [Mycobacterium xenopi 4042]|uniref:Uncharacterized protein n=1 Tax=Mycobacterium xenopi 4042 TaxID=1299334 RepID=X8DXW9_MYCXE|nr:hypothetical protein I553_9385 [Mycobacterium xenopi 4042]
MPSASPALNRSTHVSIVRRVFIAQQSGRVVGRWHMLARGIGRAACHLSSVFAERADRCQNHPVQFRMLPSPRSHSRWPRVRAPQRVAAVQSLRDRHRGYALLQLADRGQFLVAPGRPGKTMELCGPDEYVEESAKSCSTPPRDLQPARAEAWA